MAKNTLVEAVRAHALDHYEEAGWDYVVECWADDEIEEVVGRCKSPEGAIRKMKAEIKPLAAYREDIRGTIF